MKMNEKELKELVEERIATMIREEIDEEKFKNKAWLKAFKKANGNRDQAKVFYIDIRTEELEKTEEANFLRELKEEKEEAIKAKNNKIKKFSEDEEKKFQTDEEKKFQSDMDNFQGGVRMLNTKELEELSESEKKIYSNMREKFLKMEDLYFRPGSMNFPNDKDNKEFKQCVDTLRSIARKTWRKGRPLREKKLIGEMSLESESVNSNLTGKLKKLTKLYKDGTLTKAEFEKAKDNLLK